MSVRCLALVLSMVGCAADEQPSDPNALHTCGQDTPAAALMHLQSGHLDGHIATTTVSMDIVEQNRNYPAGTCTAWPMGFFQVPGEVSYSVACDRRAPLAISFEFRGPDPRTLAIGTVAGIGLTARVESPCNRPGDPCQKCDLDVSDATVELVARDASGASAPDPKLVTPDYRRAWDVVVHVPSRAAARGTGFCQDVAFDVTLAIAQSADDYRWEPARAQACSY
ncbi:MAG: hypothetical protein HYV09_40860 [Deltaproteobacteria bacterium]|nr:hypothetical protein [Deltaproteobacteria bacterium]